MRTNCKRFRTPRNGIKFQNSAVSNEFGRRDEWQYNLGNLSPSKCFQNAVVVVLLLLLFLFLFLFLFRCVLASLYEALSLRRLVGPLVGLLVGW